MCNITELPIELPHSLVVGDDHTELTLARYSLVSEDGERGAADQVNGYQSLELGSDAHLHREFTRL